MCTRRTSHPKRDVKFRRRLKGACSWQVVFAFECDIGARRVHGVSWITCSETINERVRDFGGTYRVTSGDQETRPVRSGHERKLSSTTIIVTLLFRQNGRSPLLCRIVLAVESVPQCITNVRTKKKDSGLNENLKKKNNINTARRARAAEGGCRPIQYVLHWKSARISIFTRCGRMEDGVKPVSVVQHGTLKKLVSLSFRIPCANISFGRWKSFGLLIVVYAFKPHGRDRLHASFPSTSTVLPCTPHYRIFPSNLRSLLFRATPSTSLRSYFTPIFFFVISSLDHTCPNSAIFPATWTFYVSNSNRPSHAPLHHSIFIAALIVQRPTRVEIRYISFSRQWLLTIVL